MVKGLSVFADHFVGYGDQYIIIGATACSLALELRDLEFRITKDIDMVLIVEALSTDFVRAFWDFIREGGYHNRKKSSGSPQFYRFDNPSDPNYPQMIELFSRKPDILGEGYNGHLGPIPVEEELSSLSAILLDEDYYSLIQTGRYDLDGLSCLKPEYLIVLKAKAWLDLKQQKLNGVDIDSRDISKHKNDVLRLYQIIEPDTRLPLSENIKANMQTFLDLIEQEPMALKDLKIIRTKPSDIIMSLRKLYYLG